jgi:transposase
MAASSPVNNAPTHWPFPFAPTDWEHTPPLVPAHLLSLHTRVDQLQHQVDTLPGRLNTTSNTSSKPPSSDSPCKKKRTRPKSSGQRGAPQGPLGSGPTWLAPTEGQHLSPASWAWGHGGLVAPTPDHTPQGIARPPIAVDITHGVLPQGAWGGCGQLLQAEVPRHHGSGSGPRLTALVGALRAMHRSSRRLMQDFYHAVLPLPISLGAVQKVLDRASPARVPPDAAMAALARQAPVGSIDETPWSCQHTLQGLGTMTTDPGAWSLMPPHRSTDAFCALIEDGQGVLVSEGYGVSPDGVNRRQTCWAHLIRMARGWSEKRDPPRAACGSWARKELPRWCQMAKAPPPGGEWRAW